MEIVTGDTGVNHVTPIDDAVRNTNLGYYTDRVVFDTFRALEAVAITANEVRVYGGYGMNQGRIFKIDESEYDSVTIENGSQGVKRADLIVARYLMNAQSGLENITLAVIKGQSGNTYTDPEYVTGNINEGDVQDDFPLYRVKINGIVIEAVEPLFTPLPTGGRLGLVEQKIDNHVGTKANSETFAHVALTDDYTATNTSADGIAPSPKALKDAYDALIAQITTSGNGDMLKVVYDPNNDGVIGVAQGGTGKTSVTTGSVLVGNGTSAMTERAIDSTSGGTQGSNALITSGAVKSAVDSINNSLGDQVTYSLNGTTLTITTKS